MAILFSPGSPTDSGSICRHWGGGSAVHGLTMSWGYHPTMDELACHHRGGRSELRRVGLGSVWVLYAGWWRCPGFFFLGEAVCCRHVNHSKSRWVSTLYHFLILFTLYTSDYSSFFFINSRKLLTVATGSRPVLNIYIYILYLYIYIYYIQIQTKHTL